MKIVRILFDMPYHPWGEDASTQKRLDDMTRLHMDMQDRGIKIANPESVEVFADSDRAIGIICEYNTHKHDDIRISSVSEVFSGTSQTTEDLHNVLSRLQVAAARVETQCIAGFPDGAHKPGYGMGQPGWNAHTASPIPGPLMASFNDLNLIEDACTDQIQHLLNEGWRIVAVCPQESRRPDYVLGRAVAERIYKNTGARRGEY